jgi:NAD(P)-dependent dehydrogenase (short-subunit alcohol dehydrogenase family)
MEIRGSVAFVTGANRGLGKLFATQLLERGAAKVYASARDIAAVEVPGTVSARLDVTDPASIAQAVALAPDVTLLINNAGISTHTSLVDGDDFMIRKEVETNLFGPLAVTRGFASVLTGNGGGAIVNVLSAASWAHYPDYGAYCMAKAGAWAMTNVIRRELRSAHIEVLALHMGYMDTDMAHYVPPEDKVDPAEVAKLTLDGLEAGMSEVLADETSRGAKAWLADPPDAH